jgi:putative glutamine amidotransferase
MSPLATSASRPLIGITGNTAAGGRWADHALAHEKDFVWRDYPAGVAAAGGLPVLLPCVAGASGEPDHGDAALVAETVGRLDGLLLTGGFDVAPEHYGEEPHPKLGDVDVAKDALELAAVKAARERGLPIFGICRGIQMIAVAFGGSLFQDLPSQVEGLLSHQQLKDPRHASHTVEVEAGSRLAAIVGQAGALRVNSYHHQAVKRVPDGFRVAARAADGVIEAIEATDPRHGFVLGVQWHPEAMWRRDEASRRLFRALVAACVGESAGAVGAPGRRPAR